MDAFANRLPEPPQGFFAAEEREGFFVPQMMKRTWAAEIRILELMADFFERLGLSWYADRGTLPGAVRHKGFIPWDDDIDIAMLRPDYMRMIAHRDALPPELRMMNIYTSETYCNFNTIITNNHAKKLEWDEERRKRYYGCPYIVNIDISPLDFIPEDREKQHLQKLLYSLAYKLIHMDAAVGKETDPAKQREFDQGVAQFQEYLKSFFGDRIMLSPEKPIQNALCLAADQIAQLFGEGDAAWLDYYPHMVYGDGIPYRKLSLYRDETVRLPFEYTEVPCVSDYEALTEASFGSGWRKPVQAYDFHEYPFYKKQETYFQYLGYLNAEGDPVDGYEP